MLLLAIMVLTSGCAVVTKLRRHLLPATGTPSKPREPTHAYHDYVGVIHIHTRYSDGAGTIEEIARNANAQQLDYLIVTDHNTLKALQ